MEYLLNSRYQPVRVFKLLFYVNFARRDTPEDVCQQG